MPKISVIMPVLNGGKYLKQSIESILEQTLGDFEFIIINDGSTDRTEEIIKSYQDPRVIYIRNSENKGLSASFNIGIRIARGHYIARMDADDISLVDRFTNQVKFLEENPSVGVLGSAAIMIDEHGKQFKKIARPIRHIYIKWHALFSSTMIHPTIMGKAEVFKDNLYDERWYNSEDYELWSRLLFTSSVRFANLNIPLLLYRIFPGSFTQKLDKNKREASANNSIRNIGHYASLSNREKEIILCLRRSERLPLNDMWGYLKMCRRAAKNFIKVEKLTFFQTFVIYLDLISIAFFLLKSKLKYSFLRPA